MQVDSYRFLPRAFRARYEAMAPGADDSAPVWTAFAPRLADARIALLTSAGLYRREDQEPFDAAGEKANPFWGDPSWRPIAHDTGQGDLAMMHLHVNNEDVLADHEVALPLRRLDELVASGVVGSSTPTHYSVMGYQEEGLAAWRDSTAPAIVAGLRDEHADGVVLAPV